MITQETKTVTIANGQEVIFKFDDGDPQGFNRVPQYRIHGCSREGCGDRFTCQFCKPQGAGACALWSTPVPKVDQ